MRKMVLEVPEAEKIDINGDIFEIRRSDADILEKCVDLQKKYELLTEDNKDSNDNKDNKYGKDNSKLSKNNIDAVKTAINETIAFIDEILGDGAVLKISKGRPVSTVTACGWLIAICREISKINDDYIKDKYG